MTYTLKVKGRSYERQYGAEVQLSKAQVVLEDGWSKCERIDEYQYRRVQR